MKTYKNLLNDFDFKNIQNLLLGADFPWYLNEDGKSGDDPSLNNFQFTHIQEDIDNNPWFKLMKIWRREQNKKNNLQCPLLF